MSIIIEEGAILEGRGAEVDRKVWGGEGNKEGKGKEKKERKEKKNKNKKKLNQALLPAVLPAAVLPVSLVNQVLVLVRIEPIIIPLIRVFILKVYKILYEYFI